MTALEFTTTRRVTRDPITMLVYGDPGVGKTFFAGTADDDGTTSPVLLVDVERGSATLAHRDLQMVRIVEVAQMEKLYDILTTRAHPFKTIIIDNLTDLHALYRVDVERKHGKGGLPTQQTWGLAADALMAQVRLYRNLPINVVFTAWATDKETEDGKVKTIPDLAGKLIHRVPGYVDITGYLFKRSDAEGNATRYLRVDGHQKLVAKNRYTLPPIIENATFPKVLELAYASLVPST